MSHSIPTQSKLAIIELLKQGYCAVQIAKKTNISAPLVSQFIRKVRTKGVKIDVNALDIPPKQQVKRDFEGELVARYRKLNQDVTPLYLIKRHNVTPAAAGRICEKLRA